MLSDRLKIVVQGISSKAAEKENKKALYMVRKSTAKGRERERFRKEADSLKHEGNGVDFKGASKYVHYTRSKVV